MGGVSGVGRVNRAQCEASQAAAAVCGGAAAARPPPRRRGRSARSPPRVPAAAPTRRWARHARALGVAAGSKRGWVAPTAAATARARPADPTLTHTTHFSSLPFSYGYDPLGLGKDAEQVEKYRANELLHARWAMLAAAGIIIPEGLAANGAALRGATWFETPFELANAGSLEYFAVPWGVITNPLPIAAVAAINVGLLAAVERFRASGEGPAGYSPGVGKFDGSVFDGLDPLYPGGPFDPLGLADDPEVFEELKVKEIKNGRLAMVSVLAFWVQSAVTGEGPYANWSKHVADPFGYNLLTIIGNEERGRVL